MKQPSKKIEYQKLHRRNRIIARLKAQSIWGDPYLFEALDIIQELLIEIERNRNAKV